MPLIHNSNLKKHRKVDKEVFREVHQQLRTIINLMEESLDNEHSDAIEDVLERFEKT